MRPIVSVILPVYNSEDTITSSINSVLSQTYKDLELVVVNDGSTDKTEEMIRRISDKRIKYIKNQENMGIIATLNTGIDASTGKYIARIDGDDIWCDKDKLSKQVRYLDENNKCGLVGTAGIAIDSHGYKVFKIKRKSCIQNNYLIKSNPFLHASVIMRKSLINKIGMYSKSKKFVEDYDLWLRIAMVSQVATISDSCIYYRINEQGISSKNEFNQKLATIKLMITYKKHFRKSFSYLYLFYHIVFLFIPTKLYRFMRYRFLKNINSFFSNY